MRAVRLLDVYKVGIEDIPSQDKGTLHCEEALVKITMCGICGSDYHYFRHGGLGSQTVKFPFKLGHESVGVVEYCNDPDLIGVRVAIEPNDPCNVCEPCVQHRPNICKNAKFLGANHPDAGMQEYVKVKKNQLHELGRKESDKYGVMLEPLGVAMHNVTRAVPSMDKISLGRVLVLGAGPIGLLTGIVAKNDQNDSVTMVDPFIYRLKFGKQMGLDTYKVTTTLEDNSMYDTVFDCAGTQDSYEMAIRAADNGATLVLCGIPETDYIYKNPHTERIKELSVFNTRRSAVTYEQADLYARSFDVDLDPFINIVKKFDEAQEAFEIASEYRGGVIKMALVP